MTPREARAIIRAHDPGRALLADWLDPISTACSRQVCDGCPACRILDGRVELQRAMDGGWREVWIPGS